MAADGGSGGNDDDDIAIDAVDIAGYSDQAHMTRSLQRFVGRTPGQLAVRAR